MTDILISIITPTYNRANLLAEAIASVLHQSYGNWELIVVDDGSTDNTREVVLEPEDDRIQYLHQENQQAAAARNRGVSAARGEYLCFLDDDDLLLDNHLESLIEELGRSDVAAPIYRVNQILMTSKGARHTSYWDNDVDALQQYWAEPTGAFNYFFNRQDIHAIPWPEDLLLLEDFVWMNRLLSKYTCWQIKKHTVRVRHHPNQRSGTYLDDLLLEQNIAVLAKAYNEPGVAERVPFESYRKQILHQYMHYTRQLGVAGKQVKALRTYRKAMSYATKGDWRELAITMAKILFGTSPRQ